ncbi:endoxylanase [Lutibacter sp. A80]|uniref:carbohydrate-binding family 9-like protein n=1 Tax=Lutibacter sp. A80 TaxID=2918453 RepID=UPI001F067122|nr:carbohydrate-binding family 9-like protein [Lutibacter sp. A80]UMB60282.1 endoxylanase [Lutibacter sp. A80]
MYKVKFINDALIKITGKADSPDWEKATVLTDFISAWDAEPVKKIEFRSLWSKENLFFCFKVYDNEVYIDKTDDTITSIGNSDRVELFFRTDAGLNPYYCLEIDPTPRIMDFKAYPNKEFDFEWNWPKKDILVKSQIEKEYFIVEGKVSIASLKSFGLIKNNKIESGIFRAKFNKSKGATYKPTWISWIDPNTETPNFHTPTSFGVLHLEH